MKGRCGKELVEVKVGECRRAGWGEQGVATSGDFLRLVKQGEGRRGERRKRGVQCVSSPAAIA